MKVNGGVYTNSDHDVMMERVTMRVMKLQDIMLPMLATNSITIIKIA